MAVSLFQVKRQIMSTGEKISWDVVFSEIEDLFTIRDDVIVEKFAEMTTWIDQVTNAALREVRKLVSSKHKQLSIVERQTTIILQKLDDCKDNSSVVSLIQLDCKLSVMPSSMRKYYSKILISQTVLDSIPPPLFLSFHQPEDLCPQQQTPETITQKYLRRPFPIIGDCSFDFVEIANVGSFGSEPGQFHNPTGIAIHPITRQLYITDDNNNRIQIFSPNLEFIRVVRKPVNGVPFDRPRGIDISQSLLIGVTEVREGKGRVVIMDDKFCQLFTIERCMGRIMRQPYSISFDTSDNFYVVDFARPNIAKFDSKGRELLELRPSERFSLNHGSSVVVNHDEKVLSIYYGWSDVIYFNPDGEYETSLDVNSQAGWHCIARSYGGGFAFSSLENSFVAFIDASGRERRRITIDDARAISISPEGDLYVTYGYKENQGVKLLRPSHFVK
eukprot:TRINITY_DN17312_c0_g1_i1.p1 TRINITY_DN17312_c0_g1~~TRINITY_DN17312_c0_g1_i1.p1  ORF type:complete len:445 (+),score=70.04 TRINITY_DN17312_c0_g1_i1:81-1415(+)